MSQNSHQNELGREEVDSKLEGIMIKSTRILSKLQYGFSGNYVAGAIAGFLKVAESSLSQRILKFTRFYLLV